MDPGVKIKELRTTQGISARELARRAGISQAYLSQLETGKHKNPTSEILTKIAKGLGMPYTMLLADIGYLDEEGMLGIIDKMANLKESIGKTSKGLKEVASIDNLKEFLIQEGDLRYDFQLLTHEDRQKIINYIESNLLDDEKKGEN